MSPAAVEVVLGELLELGGVPEVLADVVVHLVRRVDVADELHKLHAWGKIIIIYS